MEKETPLMTCPHPDCKSPNVCGIEIREIYDGIILWICEDCWHQWHRFDIDDPRRIRLNALHAETGPIAEKPSK